MDPVTHTLVGASLAATRMGGKSRLATAALVLGANLPDIDVLAYFAGADAALGFRRGWTHGVPALVVLPALLAIALIAWGRGRKSTSSGPPLSPRWLFGLCYLAVLTHPALDWLNTYGMRWWMPFDGTWTYGDSVFILDPWLWLLLGCGWLLAIRLSSTRAAALGLVLSALFILSMIRMHELTEIHVRRVFESQNVEIDSLMVGPMPARPWAWEFVVEHDARLRHGTLSWLAGSALHFSSFDRPSARSSALWREIEASGQVPGFLDWARFPWLELAPAGEAQSRYLMDARYARRRTLGFGGTLITLEGDPAPGSE